MAPTRGSGRQRAQTEDLALFEFVEEGGQVEVGVEERWRHRV